mgnify:CR=1 FL=1
MLYTLNVDRIKALNENIKEFDFGPNMVVMNVTGIKGVTPDILEADVWLMDVKTYEFALVSFQAVFNDNSDKIIKVITERLL